MEEERGGEAYSVGLKEGRLVLQTDASGQHDVVLGHTDTLP